MNSSSNTAKIRALNDRFRTTLQGGTVLMTRGIMALGSEAQAKILGEVQAFNAFTSDNDPWDEHDFGALDITVARNGGGATIERVFFKIEYYDLTRARGSDDPSDATRTERVMTIMLADEY